MNRTVAAFSEERPPARIVSDLSEQIRSQLASPPHVLIVFASPTLDLREVLRGLQDTLRPGVMVGCSSAGEFAESQLAEGAISALAIYSDEMDFKLCVGADIRQDAHAAAASLTSCLGQDVYRYKHRYILLLTDALAGYTEEFLSKINELTAGAFQIFGGGAGDDAQFQSTYVFAGTELLQDAAVGLAILSDKQLGIGVRHGWKPVEPAMRATETDGFELISLNSEPAFEVFARHAESLQQKLDRDNPIPFFLHNVLGVATPAGYKIRVPLGFTERGGVICATEIPHGATVNLMQTDGGSAVEAASLAAKTALEQMEGEEPAGVLFFDCVATRLRLGTGFGAELQAVRDNIASAAFVGCNSYGQVARVDGQFSGFHNCTAVVCVIPC